MFSYKVLQEMNELEILLYNYIMQNKKQVIYMTVRELADAVHVSTSTVMRFCKKAGCDGYSEFRLKLKMYLQEEQQKQPRGDLEEIKQYFQSVWTPEFEEKVETIIEIVRKAKQLIFVGVGTSGILGKYGARYFSNLGKFSQHIEDPYYPIVTDMDGETVVIALSVSGETQQVLQLASRFREHNSKLISITNTSSSTLARMSDYNLSYFFSERLVGENFNITTQVPVVFLLETIGRGI